MAADIKEGAQLPLLIAHDEQTFPRDLGDEKIAGRSDIAFVADANPLPGEESRFFLMKDFR